MLTAEWVRVRRKGGELSIVGLNGHTAERAVQMAEELLAIVQQSMGESRELVMAGFEGVEAQAHERRIKGGLIKLLSDRCTWGTEAALDPETVRRAVFERAAAMRKGDTEPNQPWCRQAILDEVATSLGVEASALECSLYADLPGSQRLTAFEAVSAPGLVAAYERGQAQAVLLRATSVEVTVQCASARAARSFFHRLKFLQLLCAINRVEDGYRVVIDGPMSLFESGTRYGQKLAMVLPVLEGCERWELLAHVQWDRGGAPSLFRLHGEASSEAIQGSPELSEAAATLVRSFGRLGTAWRVSPSKDVLNLPGVGLCVPDLVFERERQRVFLEVLGFWSRDAVFRRVDLVDRGLSEPILFAVSSRLRVSEAVLENHPSAAIYVYKDAMSARSIAERLERLVPRGEGCVAGQSLA